MPKNAKNTQKIPGNQTKKYFYRNRLKNYNSSTYFPKFEFNYVNNQKKKKKIKILFIEMIQLIIKK